MKEALIWILCIIWWIWFIFWFCVVIENFSAYMSRIWDEHDKERCERAIEYHLYVPAYCKTDYLSWNISE